MLKAAARLQGPYLSQTAAQLHTCSLFGCSSIQSIEMRGPACLLLAADEVV